MDRDTAIKTIRTVLLAAAGPKQSEREGVAFMVILLRDKGDASMVTRAIKGALAGRAAVKLTEEQKAQLREASESAGLAT